MKKTCVILSLLYSVCLAATVPPEIENEQIIAINKEPWHATLMPYASVKEALGNERRRSSYAIDLNGVWKFNWVNRPEERPEDFYKPDFPVNSWSNIPVPANWQMLNGGSNGYGTPYYRNAGYTFKKDWPHVMTEPPTNYTAFVERNPVGSYRRDFEVPLAWKGRRLLISFDGVDAAFFLWVNGKKVGYNANSRNSAEFDITPYVNIGGGNVLAVEVYRYCAGSYLEDQDMWRLSGIFRNVTLWSTPNLHIRDFFAKPDLDAQYRDGKLAVSVNIRNYTDEETSARTVKCVLYDASGKPVSGASAETNVPSLKAGEECAADLLLLIKNPRKWTAETPELYTAVLTLEKNGAVEEILSCCVGFRKVEVKGRVFMINGVPVKLKGVNRHENWPDTGHAASEVQMIEDIKLIKQANCNHVRTSHYPNDPRWYELCDQYGIYLVAEANVECHGEGAAGHNSRYEKMVVDRNVANVESFKNHPSVIIWSLGNEASGGGNLFSALKAVHALDLSRPAHYQPFGVGEKNPADIDSHMYSTHAVLESIATNSQYTKPFYLCEYAHAMNNSMGGLGEYNDLFDKYPALMGGAIWEWQDQGLWNRRDPDRPFIAYGGGFGEVPNDGYFIHKGIVFSDRSPKPHYAEVKRVYQWIDVQPVDCAAGVFLVGNKYSFISLDRFVGEWTVSENGKIIDRGMLSPMTIAPGEKKQIIVPFKKITPQSGAEYFLRFSFALAGDELWAEKGYEIAAAQFKLPVAAPAAPFNSGGAEARFEEEGSVIRVSGEGFAVEFDKKSGAIAQITSGGMEVCIPGGGPKLLLWRAPHMLDDRYAEKDWQSFGLRDLTPSINQISAEQKNGAVQIDSSITYTGKNGFSVVHTAVYTVYGNGLISVENAIVPQGVDCKLARIGLRMLLNKQLDQFEYFGRGPSENYSDRSRGSDIGLYAGSVRSQLTPYPKPMECGNHEDVRWAAVFASGGPGLFVQADGVMQASALPYTDEELSASKYSVDLPESKLTAVCLSAKTLGVGSASCGAEPFPQCMVWADPVNFSYNLRILPAGCLERDFDTYGRMPFPTNRVPLTVGAGVDAARRSQRAWKVVSVSSFNNNEGEAEKAFDGNPLTYWHSRWKDNPAKPPHTLVIDLGSSFTVAGLRYVPRQNGDNGRIGDCEVYLSADEKKWAQPVARATFPNSGKEQVLMFDEPVTGRFLKIIITREIKGRDWAAVAEIGIIPAQ